MSLFPIIQSKEARSGNTGLYVEVAWDYEKNIPIYRGGEPVLVAGKDAVLVWAWNALRTPRYRHEIFTWDYGDEIEGLTGQPYTDELKQAEAVRYVRACLLTNPYIAEVSQIEVSFGGSKLEVSCMLKTVYGEASLRV